MSEIVARGVQDVGPVGEQFGVAVGGTDGRDVVLSRISVIDAATTPGITAIANAVNAASLPTRQNRRVWRTRTVGSNQ